MGVHKIIYASNADLPSIRANAVHIMRMCDAFAENGADITLYCDEKGDVEKMYEIYGVRNHFPINAPVKKRIGRKLKGFASSLLCSWKNARCIKKEKGDVYVYGRSLLTIFFLGNRFPFSYEVHAVESNRLLAMVERCVLRRKKLISLVGISNPLKAYYEELLPEYLKGKVEVLHDGADMVDSYSIKKADIDNSDSRYPDVNIGYIGSLYPGKCMEVLLPIAKAMPVVKFHIVGGDVEWVNHWKDDADKQGIKNLEFYGKVSPADVASYYESLDICLMPYSNKIFVDKNRKLEIGQWISPLKLFEAMAHGKAIVVTDLPSIREVMVDGEDAYLLNAADIEGWVKTIEKLVLDNNLRKKLEYNGKRKLENEFSWKVRTQRIIDRYGASNR